MRIGRLWAVHVSAGRTEACAAAGAPAKAPPRATATISRECPGGRATAASRWAGRADLPRIHSFPGSHLGPGQIVGGRAVRPESYVAHHESWLAATLMAMRARVPVAFWTGTQNRGDRHGDRRGRDRVGIGADRRGRGRIGKTALLARAAEPAAPAGMTLRSARSGEFEGSYPWGVVRQLFDAIVRDDARTGRARLLRDAGPARRSGAGPGRPVAPPGGHRDEEYSILHGLYWLTADMARSSPLLLLIDDLHWADGPAWLRRAPGPAPGRAAAAADGSARPPRPPRSAGTAGRTGRAGRPRTAACCWAASRPSRPMTGVRPGPLGERACARLLGDALGAMPEAEFTGACHEMTGGNPFLLRALADSLAADGVPGRAADAGHVRRMTPAAVSRRVLLQLGRMPPEALALARAITVLGPAATLSRARQLADTGPAISVACIEALMAERLIEGQDALTFVHPLVRSAVRADMAVPVRQHLARAGRRLLGRQRQPLQDVAVHLLESGPGLGGWAVQILREAATDARRAARPGRPRSTWAERSTRRPIPRPGRTSSRTRTHRARAGAGPGRRAPHRGPGLRRGRGRRAAIALPLGHALAPGRPARPVGRGAHPGHRRARRLCSAAASRTASGAHRHGALGPGQSWGGGRVAQGSARPDG